MIHTCPVCRQTTGIALIGGARCISCAEARERAIDAGGHCVCGERRLEEQRPNSIGDLRWHHCRRCLGVTRQAA